jgi:glycosyltransferase involved in cell wall biosynthesis
MVARFEYWKGHRYAVEALHQLSAEFPQVKLHIIGGKGESFAEVMSLVEQYGLQQKVYHHEYVADNKALYHLFDVHLHVPINPLCETFGITIIEGMISARPQVLTLSGISVQTADNEKNCLVVDYCSATAIYEALKKIILDPELGKRLGVQAKLDAIRMFNYSDKVEQHLDMYADLLASNL